MGPNEDGRVYLYQPAPLVYSAWLMYQALPEYLHVADLRMDAKVLIQLYGVRVVGELVSRTWIASAKLAGGKANSSRGTN